MKVAFATKDGSTVNEHFGWCQSFLVYDITLDNIENLGFRDVPKHNDDETNEMSKIDKRIDAIQDCTILYCNAIGPTAAARLARRRIHPLKVADTEVIDQLLKRLLQIVKSPPIWLRKVLESERTLSSCLVQAGREQEKENV
ncbi:MAG: nitrogen fixation protein NifX [bacterium]|nr:MAG: nitrogen fixation protein NifX [bacterium]